MRRIYSIVFFALTVVQAQEVHYETLLNSASENSYRLKLGSTDTRIEEARLDTLYSSYYPTLSLSHSLEYNKLLNPQSNASITVGDTTINSANAYEGSLSLRLNYELYHFGTTDQQIQMQHQEVNVKTYARCSEEIKLHTEILDQYSQALQSWEELHSKESIRSLHKELYGLKERLFTAGRESRSAVADEAIEIINLERDIERSLMRYDEAVIALSKLSMFPLDPKNTQLLSFTATAPISQTPTFDESIEAQGYREKLLEKDHEISANIRSQFPVIAAYGNYYLYGSDDRQFSQAFNEMRPNSWNAGITLRVDLFQGFKYNSESQRLHLEKQRLLQEYELRRNEFTKEVQTITNRTDHLLALQNRENTLISQTQEKLDRLIRLRASGESEALSVITTTIESQERELNLKTEEIQHAHEREALRLKQRTIRECRR